MSDLHEKFEHKIQQLMEEHPDLFPTRAKFWAYLRGALRRGLWEKSPMKHRFKSAQMGPPPEGYMGRGKKGSECALTGEWEMTSKLEVDHKHGHMSLSSVEDILEFILHLLSSNSEELQLVSKDAHKIKSYAERMGITFEDAVIEKQVIAFGKLTGAEQRAILSTHDVGTVEASTAKKRKDLYRNILKEGK